MQTQRALKDILPARLGRLVAPAARALAGTLLATACTVASATPATWNLERLMALLAAHPGGRATFVERRHVAVLDRPVESSGELVYVRPGRLERHTLKPRRESVVLDGDTMTLERGGRAMQARLRDFPEAGAIVGALRGTLAGDRATLERSFGLTLGGSAERWTLDLLPSDPRLGELVHRIRVSGSQGEPRTVEILQADGDRSVTTITPVAAAATGRVESR